ncbi:STAS domain-containing protein [Mycobacterium sp. 852014-50255_SCH5639931]|uniref:STAS domain-containing protein n=1 Tax=Mycobacterium sp. 852014-50255_SCH5639931 TaxID=1834112 RepID=UPI0007FC1A96|nr:STAS domain-containing protein [Mycobacterium sp. 852014-50255_SCH5639931]OBB66153.1 anti-anti-sigma factor [Mycobacterium sp. 852014-50255_SCH5639931]
MNLFLSVAATGRSACVQVSGDLVYETVDAMVDAAGQLLARQAALADLHLDLSGLAFCDSAGLSALLLVHRRSCREGVRLHLDHRPGFLDRILDVTGTFEHLVTASHSDVGTASPDRRDQNTPGESRVR